MNDRGIVMNDVGIIMNDAMYFMYALIILTQVQM